MPSTIGIYKYIHIIQTPSLQKTQYPLPQPPPFLADNALSPSTALR